MTENERLQMTRHFGHSDKVHCEVYRVHDEKVETAQIVKLLMHSEKGDVHLQKGKTLAEMDIPEVPELEMIQDQYANNES